MITSAGLLVHRPGQDGPAPELLLGHMGGPFWARKDEGAWSIPKGEHGPGEDPRAAAVREFTEELGVPPPPGPLDELGSVRQRGKIVTVFALGVDRFDLDLDGIAGNTFEMIWPPRSGARCSFPEIDRAGWFAPEAAHRKLVAAQGAFVDRLVDSLQRMRGTASP